MRAGRAFRVVTGLLVLVLFAACAFLHMSHTPSARDIDTGVWKPAAAQPNPADVPPPAAEPEATQTPEPEATPEPTQTPEPTLDPNSPAGRAAALGLPAPPEIDIESWEYILVNSTHEIGSDFAPPEIVKVGAQGCPQDSRIAEALEAFADGCKAEGLPVYLSSGYRSYSEQQANFNRKLNEGYSREAAAKIVAVPGTSEHQTGLCCDITDIYRNPKDPAVLSKTDTFLWLEAHCAEYGFILRFPNGEIAITGIMYEPWHFRYVGVEAATYIMENELTLEEFVALYTGEEVPGAEETA